MNNCGKPWKTGRESLFLVRPLLVKEEHPDNIKQGNKVDPPTHTGLKKLANFTYYNLTKNQTMHRQAKLWLNVMPSVEREEFVP